MPVEAPKPAAKEESKQAGSAPGTVKPDEQGAIAPVPAKVDVPKPGAAVETVSIVNIIRSISEDKAKLAESFGVPVRPLLQWAAAMENSVREQHDYLVKMGADLKPLTDAIKARQEAAAKGEKIPLESGSIPSSNPMTGLASLLPMLPQLLGMGGSTAEQYFIKLGMEQASLGNFMTREMFKRVMPSGFAEWEKAFAEGK